MPVPKWKHSKAPRPQPPPAPLWNTTPAHQLLAHSPSTSTRGDGFLSSSTTTHISPSQLTFANQISLALPLFPLTASKSTPKSPATWIVLRRYVFSHRQPRHAGITNCINASSPRLSFEQLLDKVVLDLEGLPFYSDRLSSSQHFCFYPAQTPPHTYRGWPNQSEQKMQSLRVEADDANAQVEELKKQVKTLEQENLQKEQEITSLQHKNGLLDAQVEKLEGEKKDLKATGGDTHQHATQNETLQRRLQLLEEEAEEADKNLRETNDKYVTITCVKALLTRRLTSTGSAKLMSRPDISNARFKLLSKSVTSGSQNTKRSPRNTLRSRKSWRTSRPKLARCNSNPALSSDSSLTAVQLNRCHVVWIIGESRIHWRLSLVHDLGCCSAVNKHRLRWRFSHDVAALLLLVDITGPAYSFPSSD